VFALPGGSVDSALCSHASRLLTNILQHTPIPLPTLPFSLILSSGELNKTPVHRYFHRYARHPGSLSLEVRLPGVGSVSSRSAPSGPSIIGLTASDSGTKVYGNEGGLPLLCDIFPDVWMKCGWPEKVTYAVLCMREGK
jgi:hypothetical protein